MSEILIDWSQDFFDSLPDLNKIERESNGINKENPNQNC